MKTAVVFYSMGGNTAYAAEIIATETGADLIRLYPKKEYPNKGIKKFLWGGKSSMMSESPELNPYVFDPSKYDTVVIGFPIWAFTFAPPIRTFLKENSLEGKKVALFACQSGNGAEKAFAKIKALAGITETAAELVLVDPKDIPDRSKDLKILDFCNKIKEAE